MAASPEEPKSEAAAESEGEAETTQAKSDEEKES
jgi:hypothetical protein